jgi:hypothetical protein
MEHWYKVATPREEVRQGRSFNPDEFAIHLEQVIAGTALADLLYAGAACARRDGPAAALRRNGKYGSGDGAYHPIRWR